MASNMQKIFAISVVAILAVAGVAAVAMHNDSDESAGKLKVVASFYPLEYMSKSIGGEHVSVSTLIPGNTDLHSWSPSASDIRKASKADVLVYNGAGLDSWVDRSLLGSIDTSKMLVVKTTKDSDLNKSESSASRVFVFDNDKGKMLVYDVSKGKMTLSGTHAMSLNVLPNFSGYFDSAIEATNSEGYTFLFIPNANNITVLNTGLHGDHFHDPEVVTTINAGKPVHSCVSPDGKKVCFALDTDEAAIVIPVDAPANSVRYPFAGSNSGSHATVVIDKNDRLYFADMKEPAGSNLWIVDMKTGSTLVDKGNAGTGPHGGFYSKITDKVYLNCANGISVISSEGFQELISYSHDGSARLTRSWLADDGVTLVSYVGDSATGKAYVRIVAYNLQSKTLSANMPVSVPIKADNGWPSSILVGENVVISDPSDGSVIMANIVSKTTKKIGLELATVPQAIRVTGDPVTGNVWAVCEDGTVCTIDDKGTILSKNVSETGFGNNLVVSAVTVSDGKDSLLYDPHTWVSPYMALKQGEAVYNALVRADADNSAYYADRWSALRTKLTTLDSEYMTAFSGAGDKAVFVNHEAYGYLAQRYGFEQEGLIGISADEQPSASAIAHMAEEMEEHGTYTIYLDPVYSDKYVKTLKETVQKKTGHEVTILKMYLMTGEKDKLDYLGQMEANLIALKAGIGK